MKFERFICGPLENNVFLVFCEKTKNGAIIDPALGSSTALFLAKELGLKIKWVLNTHGHPDHTIEDAFAIKETGARLAIHRLDEYRLSQNSKIVTPYLSAKQEPVAADKTFTDGEKIAFGTVKLKAIHTPGHTEGSSCFFEEKTKTLFSGDTLFKNTYGRTDFEGGNAEQMKQSLKKIYAMLPKKTLVLPGHGEFTTIGAEKWIEKL